MGRRGVILCFLFALVMGCTKKGSFLDYWAPEQNSVIAAPHYVVTYNSNGEDIIKNSFSFDNGEVAGLTSSILRRENGRLYEKSLDGKKWNQYPEEIENGSKISVNDGVYFGFSVSSIDKKVKINGVDRNCIELTSPSFNLKKVYCKNIGEVFLSSVNTEPFVVSLEFPNADNFQKTVALRLVDLMVKHTLIARNKTYDEKEHDKLIYIYGQVFQMVSGLAPIEFYGLEDQKKYKYGQNSRLGIIESAIFSGCIIRKNLDSVLFFLENKNHVAPFGNSNEGAEFEGDIATCLDKVMEIIKT